MKLVEKYEIPFDTGEVDDDGNPIFTYHNHLEETATNGKQLKRVGNRRHTQSANLKTDSLVDVYQDDQLLATWQIIPQYWQVDEWRDYTKIPTALEIVDGHLVTSGSQGGFSWDIDIAWTSNESKWKIHAVAPGFLFRFKWNIVFTTLGQELMLSGVLKLGADDYPGEVLNDYPDYPTEEDKELGTLIPERNIIFEPEGVEDELIVDPYLSIVEDATYLWVVCSRYALRFRKDSDGYNVVPALYDPTMTTMWDASSDKKERWRLSTSSTFYLEYDSNATNTIIEKSSTRVVVKTSARFSSNGGSTNAYYQDNGSDCEPCIIYIYIYPDRYFVDAQFTLLNNATDIIDLAMGGIALDDNNVTNEIGVYEDSGDETQTIYGADDACEYCAALSEEVSCFLFKLYIDLSLSEDTHTSSACEWVWGQQGTGTINAGTYRQISCVVVDSPDAEDYTVPGTSWVTSTSYSLADLRANDGVGWECISAHTSSSTDEPGVGANTKTYWTPCHKYTLADRQAMNLQYFDIDSNANLPDIVDTTGALVTDLNIPATIDSSEAFASDGAYHLDLDSTDHDAKIEFNQDEEKPAIVLHDPSIRTGDGTTEHLTFYDKMESVTNAHSPTVGYSTVAVNGSPTLVDGVRGDGIEFDSTDYFQLARGTDQNFNTTRGTICFNVWHDDVTDYYNRVFEMGSATASIDSNFSCILNGPTVRININSVTDVFTYELKDSIFHPVQIIWDTDLDLVILVVDGEVKGIDTTAITPYSGAYDAYMYIGNNRTSNRPLVGIIDNFRIYDACILPYGSFVSAQHINDDDYSDAHSEINTYVHGDEDNTDSVKIGSGTVTVSGMTHVTGPDGVSNSAFHSDGDGTGTDYISIPSAGVINNTKGKIAFWYKHLDTSGSVYATICEHTSATNALRIRIESTTNFLWYFPDGTSHVGLYHTAFDSNWHHYGFLHDVDLGFVELWIDGVLSDSAEEVMSDGNFSSGNLIIGNTNDGLNRDCGGDLYGFTITDDPYTPPVPFVLGHGPVVVNKVYDGSTLLVPGTDYDVVSI